MWYINLVCFFSTKTMRIAEIHFGHCVGKYDPSTELPLYFCTGIGPLQLGAVLVYIDNHKKACLHHNCWEEKIAKNGYLDNYLHSLKECINISKIVPCTIRRLIFRHFLKIPFFTVKGVIFSIFLAIFQCNFGDSWDIHGMRHIILGYYFQILQ